MSQLSNTINNLCEYLFFFTRAIRLRELQYNPSLQQLENIYCLGFRKYLHSGGVHALVGADTGRGRTGAHLRPRVLQVAQQVNNRAATMLLQLFIEDLSICKMDEIIKDFELTVWYSQCTFSLYDKFP